MEFTTKEDIEAPIAFVFAQVTDFVAFERQALRRGADVRRRDALPRPGVGSGWDLTFKFRGKERNMRAEVIAFDQPNGFSVETASGGLDGVTVIDLVPLSRGRTRLSITIGLEPRTLPARLMVQSLRLAKSNLNKRLAERIATFAADVQDRYRRQG